MKFILSLLISIILSTPVLADTDPCTNYDEDLAGCRAYTGCGYSTQYDECNSCPDDKYNDGNFDECQSCSSYPFQYNSGMIWDQTPSSNHPGQASCPWVCDTDYWYKNDAGTGCVSCPNSDTAPAIYPDTNNIGDCSSCPSNLQLIHANNNKYYCGQCGAGTPTTQGGITTCSCFTGANHINGDIPPQGNIRVECLCPGIVENGQCVCPLNKYLHQDNNGVYLCETCPEHSTSAVGSTNVNDCQCDSDFPKRILDENNNLISCSACADNASFQDGSCQCNSGYYGDGASSCKQCPIGTTTTTIGATQRSDCKMTSATQFCYGSGDNKKCMHLIPAGTVISVSNNT